jgi:cell division protein FtsW (lipid II flippase)
VRRLFPVWDTRSKKDHTQSLLLIMAGLIMFAYALILTLAPAVRYQSGSDRYQYQHWIGLTIWVIVFACLHYQTIRKVPHRDPYILAIIALLSGIGLMTIWRLFPNLGLRQTIWIAISGALLFFGIKFPEFLQYLRRFKYLWLVLGLLLTGLTIFFGTHPLGAGSTRWLRLFGIHFQPSEPLKMLLIIYLSGFFTDRLSVYHRKLEGFLPSVIIIGIALLLLVFQRDLGTASIFLMIYLAMLFTSRGSRSVLWATPILFLVAGAAGYFFIDVVRIRVDTWLNPFGDPMGASYQIIQSMVAIAEGDIVGAGPGLGSPGLIPVSVSDFIFSAIAEELGFLGVSAIILLLIVLLYRSIILAIRTQNSFHRYLTLGLIFYYGMQSILIIGGNIGLLPLTGVTLPFLSYGGSSLLVSFSGILILLTISDQTNVTAKSRSIYQPRYGLIGILLISVLILEIIVTSLLSFWFNPSLINRPENPRWIIHDRFSERGNILDRDNQVIITNIGEIGQFQRINYHVPLYPVIGYTHPVFGQTGIELSMYPYLRGIEGHPFATRFWHELLFNQPPTGLDVRLTLDLEIQRTADDLLGANTGAVVLMNANSGEILAMATHPYFDAANLETEWEDLINDENAPLINRATQGLYPPGATLIPFIIASQPSLIQQMQEPETVFEDIASNLECALPVEEPLTWQTLIGNGCLNLQDDLAARIDGDQLLDLYQNLGFFTAPRLHLPVAQATLPDPPDPTANFTISPLQMAMAASALTNEGVLPGPRIVNAIQDPEDGWNTLAKLQSNATVFQTNAINQVSQMLQVPNTPYWQVLSIITRENNQPITWYIAGTIQNWQGQPVTVVVVLELEAPEIALSIGKTLIEQAIPFDGQIP